MLAVLLPRATIGGVDTQQAHAKQCRGRRFGHLGQFHLDQSRVKGISGGGRAGRTQAKGVEGKRVWGCIGESQAGGPAVVERAASHGHQEVQSAERVASQGHLEGVSRAAVIAVVAAGRAIGQSCPVTAGSQHGATRYISFHQAKRVTVSQSLAQVHEHAVAGISRGARRPIGGQPISARGVHQRQPKVLAGVVEIHVGRREGPRQFDRVTCIRQRSLAAFGSEIGRPRRGTGCGNAHDEMPDTRRQGGSGPAVEPLRFRGQVLFGAGAIRPSVVE